MISETWLIPILIFLTSFILGIIVLSRAQKRPQPPLPPGPVGLPIVGNLLSLDPELHTYFTNLAQTHGPILSLRLGTKLGVVISSAALAKEVLRDHDAIFANRDAPIAGILGTYGGRNIVWSPYGPTWRLLRKVCVREMLGAATLDGLSGVRHRETRRMVQKMSEKAGSTEGVNIGEEAFRMVMRVVTATLWGGSKASESEERESIESEFRKAVTEFVELLGAPNLSDFYPGLAWLDLQGVEKKMKRCAKWLDEIFEEVIKQRMKTHDEGKKVDKDFLEVLLQLKDHYEGGEGADKVSFSMIHLKALLIDMVVGGTDTTSNTTELAMVEIVSNPEVMKKIQQELDALVGRDNIVEEHHIYKLPYLNAVMKESLRLHPAIPLLVPHCPSQSCVIGGYTIPKGSRVFFNLRAIHRDPSSWPDPVKFDPERFLNAKTDFTGSNFSSLPFSSGRRICAGIAMAEKMVLFSLASLLHSFDWKLPDGAELDLQEKFGIVLTKKTPLQLIPECRLSSPALYE